MKQSDSGIHVFELVFEHNTTLNMFDFCTLIVMYTSVLTLPIVDTKLAITSADVNNFTNIW